MPQNLRVLMSMCEYSNRIWNRDAVLCQLGDESFRTPMDCDSEAVML